MVFLSFFIAYDTGPLFFFFFFFFLSKNLKVDASWDGPHSLACFFFFFFFFFFGSCLMRNHMTTLRFCNRT